MRARWGALLIVGWTSFACSRTPSDPARNAPTCEERDAQAPVDPTLVAFLSRARAAHHTADLHEEARAFEAAIRALDTLITGIVPGGNAPPPEVREVLADTHARLADLERQRSRFDPALAHIDTGLKWAADVSYFRGHLFEVRGLIHEQHAKLLNTQGDALGSEEAKRAALDAFDQAMNIQGAVIERTLNDAGTP